MLVARGIDVLDREPLLYVGEQSGQLQREPAVAQRLQRGTNDGTRRQWAYHRPLMDRPGSEKRDGILSRIANQTLYLSPARTRRVGDSSDCNLLI